MKSFALALAVVAAVAALCKADSFEVPVPWIISDFLIFEPEQRAMGIGGIWSFNITDSPTQIPQGFITPCRGNLKYYNLLSDNPKYKEGIYDCRDASATWTARSLGSDCTHFTITHGYPCELSADGDKICLDQGELEFCLDDYFTKTVIWTAISHPAYKQTRPMSIYPHRNVSSSIEVTV